MKILFISHDTTLTGAPRVLFEIAQYMSMYFDVAIVSSRPGVIEELYSMPVEYCDFNEEKIKRLIDDHAPDLLYINSIASIKWVEVAKAIGIKYILHIHEKLHNDLSRFSIDPNDIIWVSRYCKEDVDAFQLKDENLFYEFINTESIDNYLVQPVKFPSGINLNKKIVLGVGTVAKRKGTDIFIEVAKAMPGIQFLWIGFCWEADIFKDLPSNFFHVGETHNPYFYINKCDLFTLTSREDPFPLVVLESLYLNKPTVCFSQGNGSNEILRSLGYVIDGYPDDKSLINFINQFDFIHNKNTKEVIEQSFSNKIVLPKIKEFIMRTVNLK